MSRSAWIILAGATVLLLAVVWAAKNMGAFDSPEDLDRAAENVDGGVFEEPPFADGAGGAGGTEADPGKVKGDHSLALSGRASIGLHDFAMNDKQGREVLRVKSMQGFFDVTALRRGVYRMQKAKVDGVEVTLYRDDTGQISLTHALGQTPAPVRQGLHMPPKDEPEDGPWLIEVGPVEVTDATLTLGFTGKPVQFHIDSAKITVRRRAEDAGPMIYIEDAEGTMTKPKPLPKPVRIAFANGLVRLAGEPLVDLVARACLGRDELRTQAVVPARNEAVTMTIDSQGLLGALGRMGLKIASRRESEKLHYVHAPVKIEGGPRCRHEEKHEKREEKKEEKREEKKEKKAEKAAE